MNVARQIILYEDSPRAFIAVEMLRTKIQQVALVGAVAGDDVGMNGFLDVADFHGVDERFADLWMEAQNVFHFSGLHAIGADLDESAFAPYDVDVSQLVGPAEIARTKIAVPDIRIGFQSLAPQRRAFRHIEFDLADPRRDKFVAVVVQNHNGKHAVDSADGIARSVQIKSEGGMNLAAAVTLADDQAETLFEALRHRRRQSRAAGNAHADRGKIESAFLRNARQHFENKRHGPEHGDSLPTDGIRRLDPLEALLHDDRADDEYRHNHVVVDRRAAVIRAGGKEHVVRSQLVRRCAHFGAIQDLPRRARIKRRLAGRAGAGDRENGFVAAGAGA